MRVKSICYTKKDRSFYNSSVQATIEKGEIDTDEDGSLYAVIHTGSRHLGKEVTEYYLQEAHFSPEEGFPAVSVPGGSSMGKKSLTMQIPVYRYGTYVIWGATARILKSFLDRVKEI